MLPCRMAQIGLSLTSLVWLWGCASRTNHVRLIGSHALDLPGQYPHTVSLGEGAFIERPDVGAVMLTGADGHLLFYYKGYHNRFELVLEKDSQSITYRRLGQRPVMIGDGVDIPKPIGIAVTREDGRLEGTFDVMLARDDLPVLDPAFEHYPRHLRAVGRFAVPHFVEPFGPTTQPGKSLMGLRILPRSRPASQAAAEAMAPSQ